MKKILIVAALLVLGFGCGKAEQPPNSYPGDEPYVAPTSPPPGV